MKSNSFRKWLVVRHREVGVPGEHERTFHQCFTRELFQADLPITASNGSVAYVSCLRNFSRPGSFSRVQSATNLSDGQVIVVVRSVTPGF